MGFVRKKGYSKINREKWGHFPVFDAAGRRRPGRVPICALLALLTLSAAAAAQTATGLPLGAGTLPESRTETTLAPGVTLTAITRGMASRGDHWTISVLMPASGNSFLLLGSQNEAQEVASKLRDDGFTPEIYEERNPDYKDFPAGTLGYTVRVGTYATRDAARTDMAALSTLGYRTSIQFTGENGDSTTGPWKIRVLTIDPRLFRGEITATHGSSLAKRVTVSALAQQSGALAAINAGFFVMSPSDGVPGDPAGLFIDHGKVLSEATKGRITMNMFNRNSPDGETSVQFQELRTTMNLLIGSELVHRMDGINRKPGVIRNCGGTGDTPTEVSRHDFTCTDSDELVVITPEFGAPAPSGEGIEAAVDGTGIVTELRSRTGGAVPSGGMLVQGIGAEAGWLEANVRAGASVRFEAAVTDAKGRPVRFDSNDSAVNGGPGLVAGGRPEIRPLADGLIHPDDPSFFLRWGVRRNPRTMAGVDGRNRILLVTVDGRQPGYSLGLSLAEGADLMIGLGAVSAMNLDGGGSTAMVIKGQLINSPSEPTGERAVGDAIIVK